MAEAVLADLSGMTPSLQTFRSDTLQCQLSLLARGIGEATGYVDALSDLMRQVDDASNRISAAVHQKLNQVSEAVNFSIDDHMAWRSASLQY